MLNITNQQIFDNNANFVNKQYNKYDNDATLKEILTEIYNDINEDNNKYASSIKTFCDNDNCEIGTIVHINNDNNNDAIKKSPYEEHESNNKINKLLT
jgi:hypothetical protein